MGIKNRLRNHLSLIWSGRPPSRQKTFWTPYDFKFVSQLKYFWYPLSSSQGMFKTLKNCSLTHSGHVLIANTADFFTQIFERYDRRSELRTRTREKLWYFVHFEIDKLSQPGLYNVKCSHQKWIKWKPGNHFNTTIVGIKELSHKLWFWITISLQPYFIYLRYFKL